MHISILNRSLKSFVSRLEALKSSYPLTLLSVTALDGLELFQLNLNVKSDQELAAFAQDAKFGFGEHFSIERALSNLSEDYKTEYFVEVNSSNSSEDKFFALREKLNQANVDFRALEFSAQVDSNMIRAYANSSEEQEMIATLVS